MIRHCSLCLVSDRIYTVIDASEIYNIVFCIKVGNIILGHKLRRCDGKKAPLGNNGMLNEAINRKLNDRIFFAKLICLYNVILITLTHKLAYAYMGQINQIRNLDYARDLILKLDFQIPCIPYFVFFYMALWLYPVLLTIYFINKVFDIAYARIIAFSLLIFIIIPHIFWYAYPVKMHLRVPIEQLQLMSSGPILQFLYSIITPWNTIPSFHCAVAYFSWRIANTIFPKLKTFLFIFMIIMFASTVLLRLHYILDILGGILYGEFMYQFVFLKMVEKKESFYRMSNEQVVVVMSLMCFSLIVILQALHLYGI